MNQEQVFKLKAPYQPTGDQPQAIAELVKGFKEGNQFETLLGRIQRILPEQCGRVLCVLIHVKRKNCLI